MRGKAYAIMRCKDIQDISLSRLNAQEMLMEAALENGYHAFLYYFNHFGCSLETALEVAQEEMDHWQIWEFNLV